MAPLDSVGPLDSVAPHCAVAAHSFARLNFLASLVLLTEMNPGFFQQFDLMGKVAIVTGASRGIGAAIAAALAQCGANVVVSSRKQEGLEAVAASIRAADGRALAIAAHANDPAQLKSLVDQTCETFGGVDIVVNNAAANPLFGPIAEQTLEAFDKTIGVNLRGPFELSRLVYPVMRARGGGSIVNISSVGAIRPEPLLGLYNVSKAGLVCLTQAMAREWGADNIRVNVICPGLTQTKFSEALWSNPEIVSDFLTRVPLGRVAAPEEMAPLAVYLASAASSYVTGAVFTIDGGLTI